MYKNILVPTDGSKLSFKAVKQAAAIAKLAKAKVTALYVIEPFMPRMSEDGIAFLNLPRLQAEYRTSMEEIADAALDRIAKALAPSKVACDKVSTFDPKPWHGILETARKRKCDLVVMASHGRGGLTGVVLGSETHKVLAHSNIPVLVCR